MRLETKPEMTGTMPNKPLKLLQLTDCHIVPEGKRLFTLDPAERLRQAVADINRNHADAALCVLSGDLTDAAAPEAYRSLRQILSELHVPYRLMPGNHDDRSALRAAFPDIEADEDGFLQSQLDTPAGVLLFLDTVEAGIHSGVYCKQRCRWLERALTEAKDEPVYLFLHHPPMDIGMPRLDQYRILQSEGLADVVGRFPNIRHLFFGHVHRPIAGSWLGIPLSSVPGTNHQNSLDLSEGRANVVSLEPPAYGVILIGPDSTIVHQQSFLSDAERFHYDAQAGAGSTQTVQ